MIDSNNQAIVQFDRCSNQELARQLQLNNQLLQKLLDADLTSQLELAS